MMNMDKKSFLIITFMMNIDEIILNPKQSALSAFYSMSKLLRYISLAY